VLFWELVSFALTPLSSFSSVFRGFFRVILPYYIHFLLAIACLAVIPILRMGNAIDWKIDSYRDLRHKYFLRTYIFFCNGSTKALLGGALFCIVIFIIVLLFGGQPLDVILNEEIMTHLKNILIWLLFFNLAFDSVSDSLDTKSERMRSWITEKSNDLLPIVLTTRTSNFLVFPS